MADRYWIMKEHMGYAGTDSEEEIDLCDWYSITPEEVAEMSQEEVQKDLDEAAWQQAIEKVDASAEPDDNQEIR